MAVSVRNLGVPLLLFSAFQICLFSIGAVDMINYLNLAALVGMLVFLFIHTKLKGRFHRRVFLALFISVIGITYFAIQHNRYLDLFPSMLFFLLPKLFFTSAFYLDFRSAPELDKRGARIAIGISFLMSLGYYLAIRAHLGILKLPVMIGIFTSSLMFMMACFRNLRVNSRSFWTILAGVLLYIFAEGILAYHSFAQPILAMDVIYAISLVMGLYLLVLGTVSRTLLHSQVD